MGEWGGPLKMANNVRCFQKNLRNARRERVTIRHDRMVGGPRPLTGMAPAAPVPHYEGPLHLMEKPIDA